jgi:hypothetical protein
MSSLREIVSAQRVAEPTFAATASQPASGGRTLQIEPGGCERWILAWSQFISAHYDEQAGREEFSLKFAEYEVVVKGRRLTRLFADVAAMRLESIRGQPQSDLAALSGSGPVVSEITIRALGRPGSPS